MDSTAFRTTSSLEDYLEAIAIINGQDTKITVTALSKSLEVKKPSVVAALKKLSCDGLVIHNRYRDVKLTPAGNRIAAEIYRRHQALRSFLVNILNVDPKIAEEDACRMEHSLSSASLEKLGKFLEFVLNCPQGDPEWLKGFNYFFEHGKRDERTMAKCQRMSCPGN